MSEKRTILITGENSGTVRLLDKGRTRKREKHEHAT
jgi:hypothetical protein